MQWQQLAAGPQTEEPIHAALDLVVSNNCRLLAVRPFGSGLDVPAGFSRIVRPGECLRNTARLSGQAVQAVERAMKAPHVCVGKTGRRRVTRMRCVALGACRRADNCAGFEARVKRETGVCRTSSAWGRKRRWRRPVARPCSPPSRAPVFDIGGGGGALMRPVVREHEGARLPGSSPSPRGAGRMSATFGSDRMSDRACRAMTATAALRRCRPDRADRVQPPHIGQARTDMAVGGCVSLEAIRRMWPAGSPRVADRGTGEDILSRVIVGDCGAA